MLRKALFAALILILLVSFFLPRLGSAQTPQQQASPSIYLKSATFTPGGVGSVEQALGLPPELILEDYPPGTSGYYIVQFSGPVIDEWKAALQRMGATILDYIPDYAFKVKMSPEVAARIQRYQPVNWVGLFQPAYKLSPQLRRTGTNFYKVVVEKSGDLSLVLASLDALGVSVTTRAGRNLEVIAESNQLGAIASILDVAWVENFAFHEKHNEYGAGVIMGANVANLSGYDGSTQIVAVADTGFGTGVAATAFADIPTSRITAIYDWPGVSDPTCYNILGDGAQDVDSGHGTHTAASVLSGGRPDGTGKGTAPAASLVFQAVENYADMIGLCAVFNPDGYYLLGLPDDLHSLYQQAYDAGARIHSNSWGSNAAGDYTQDSADTDDFIWDNPDMTITFSAGNAGTDGNSNGVVDDDSIGSPATAKNVITVGASENDRQGDWACDTGLAYTTCAAAGGQNTIFTYGAAWPADFPANPLASDPSAGNANQMAAFSSRGPTDDGRIKPDVVAPGTWVLSGYSDLYQQGYDGSSNPQNGAYQYDGWGFPADSFYKYMGGTSMSNPLTAGAAAVVRDYYQKAYSHAASAALTKATLINSATDLLDENNDGANDNDFPIPNNHEGWGLVNLVAATAGTQQYVDASPGLGTSGSAVYQYDLNPGQPFKVTLVWSDFPSTAAAAVNLVNNLDLVVTAPGGATYRGNVFSAGWSQTGGSADQRNNVENVYIQSADAGIWTVQVSGTNVPSGPQPYALVVAGSFDGALPTATFTPSPTATQTPTVTFTPSPTATTPGDPPTATPSATATIPSTTNLLYLSWTTYGSVGRFP